MKGMTLNQHRSALRLDLKDSGALWTDAELNRSIGRAVQDLSRHLPLEKVYEETLSFTVTSESFTTPAAASATAIVSAASLATVGNGDVLAIADYTPDVPRRLTVTLTDANASITRLTVVVKGYDHLGHYIEESWYLKDLTTAVALQGKLHFKRVTEVEVNDIAGNGTGDTLSVGTGNAYDSWIWLGYKPIRPKSETVTNAAGTTTYSRDTDYTMDYYNGAIRFINGGSMAAGTAYLASYTKSKLGMDISSILPIASRISRVEYPADQVPQQFAAFSIYGDFLHIGSKLTGKSQEEMTTNHVAIYYEQPHSPPSEGSPGSYPAILDELISIGAGGDALLTKALELEHQAVTDLVSLRTELGLTTAVHTLIATALGKVTTYVTDMDTALDAAIVQIAAAATALGKINSDSGRTYLTDADTALDAYTTAIANAATALGKVATYLENNTNEDAKSWLTKITTDIAGLRTAILAAQDAANTALDGISFTDVGTYLASAIAALTNAAAAALASKTPLDAVDIAAATTALAAAKAISDIVLNTDLDKVTTGAEAYLNTGDDNITGVTVAPEADRYATYSGARVNIATARVNVVAGYVQEAQARINSMAINVSQAAGYNTEATSYVGEASQHVAAAAGALNRERAKAEQATGYINEATSRLDNLRSYIEQSRGWMDIANGFISESVQRINLATGYINEAVGRVGIADRYLAEAAQRVASANSYIAEADGRFNMTQAFVREAETRLGEISMHLQEANQWAETVQGDIVLSDRFRTEGQARLNEFEAKLRSKNEYRKRTSTVSTKQPA